VAPAIDVAFPVHLMQVSDVTAPETDEYVPSAQSKHLSLVSAPGVAENFPAAQSVQTDEDTAPSAVEYLPAGQSVHSLEPKADLKVPATHGPHAPSETAVYPVLH